MKNSSARRARRLERDFKDLSREIEEIEPTLYTAAKGDLDGHLWEVAFDPQLLPEE